MGTINIKKRKIKAEPRAAMSTAVKMFAAVFNPPAFLAALKDMAKAPMPNNAPKTPMAKNTDVKVFVFTKKMIGFSFDQPAAAIAAGASPRICHFPQSVFDRGTNWQAPASRHFAFASSYSAKKSSRVTSNNCFLLLDCPSRLQKAKEGEDSMSRKLSALAPSRPGFTNIQS